MEMEEDIQVDGSSRQDNIKRSGDKSSTPEGIETTKPKKKKKRVRESKGLEYKPSVKRKKLGTTYINKKKEREGLYPNKEEMMVERARDRGRPGGFQGVITISYNQRETVNGQTKNKQKKLI